MKRTIVLILLCVLAGCAAKPSIDHDAPFRALQKTLTLKDYSLSYVRQGSGPPLILLHGGGSWSYTWRYNIDELAKRFDVIAIDMIGHGYTRRTAKTTQPYTLTETTTFIAGVLDRLGIARANFVGNSWGGGWALAFAQAHPDRVGRLVLIGTSGLPGQERPEWELLKQPVVGDLMISLASRSDVEKGQREAIADPSRVKAEDVDALWQAFRQSEVRSAQTGFMRGLDWSVTQNAAPRTFKETLILWGDHDRYVSRQSQEDLYKLLPNSKFKIVKDAGHVAQEDAPHQINTMIFEFILDGTK